MDVSIECVCPTRAGAPRHPDGDTVTLRERLDFRSVTAIRHGISFVEREESDAYTAEILAVLTEGYILHGVESWTLVGEDGKPIPVTRTAIRERLLENLGAAQDVGDAADELYGEKVLLPLLVRASTSSRATPTGTSTSRSTGSPTRPRKPSSPSSITSIPTAATGTTGTSRDGASSSSPSSTSAA